MGEEFKSQIISGTMTWGKWGMNLSTSEMRDLIEYNVEIGINSFDHADIYGGYTTEAEFGDALKFSTIQREKIKLITKCGIQYPCELRPGKIKHYDYSKKHIRFSVENSLKNLKTDYIDIFLLHRPSPLMNPYEIGSIISDLIDEGKILEFGVSNFKESQIELLKSCSDIKYNQIECSVSKNDSFTNGTIDYCQLKKIKIMAWAPLGEYFKNNNEKRLRLKNILEKHCQKYSCNENQLLLAWLLKHPTGISPVIGTTRKKRLLSSVKALLINIEIVDWFEILEASNGKKIP